MIKHYIKYLKENPKGYWFKARWYGWGWVPVKWQGWATVAIYIFLAYVITASVDANSHSVSDTLYGATVPLAILTMVFIAVCYIKGEKPRWNWGPPKKKK